MTPLGRSGVKLARAAGLAAAVLVLQPALAAADMFGLVVGIDDYQHITKLRGAVNDARDVAEALKTAGAKSVALLTDGAANRAAILGAWDRLIAGSRPDDTLVLSYAGHGGQEPERVKGSEADGMDEVLLLAGFAEKGAGTEQRIVDDDIALMLQKAAPRRVVFVSDACHSGTMTRGVDRRSGVLGTRFASYGAIEDDELPPPTREAIAAEQASQDNVTFFAAVAEHELAPEVLIDGQPRGALSWAFANALRGKADSDGDGTLSKGELERFVEETVRMKAAGRQHPQVHPEGNRALALAQTPGSESGAAAGRPIGDVPPVAPMALRVLGGDSAALALVLRNVRAAGADEPARLVWDPVTGDVVSDKGDVVASVPGRADERDAQARLQRVVDKWALLDRVTPLAESGAMTLALKPGDGSYRRGQTFTLSISGMRRTNFTLLNLGSDGTVNFLYPLDTAQFKDPLRVPTDRPYDLTLRVEPPFGADHFVAIASAAPLTDLHRDLAAIDGQPAADRVGDLLARHLKGQVADLGWHGIYTVGP